MGCNSSKPATPARPPDTSQPECSSSASGADGSGSGSMYKARLLLQELMALKGSGAASQAAEIILSNLGCGDVSIIASTSRPDLFIRLSGQGMFPARTYHRSQILLHKDRCAAGRFTQDGHGYDPAVLYRTVSNAEEAASQLPQDWEQEFHNSGMRTWMAVPITAHSSEPMLGVLTLASCQPGAFWESWWEPLVGIVAAGLVPLMQECLNAGLVELAMHVLSTATICDFMTAVLHQTSLLLGSVYNKSMSVRIGLLAPDHESMLLMLPGPQTGKSTVKEGNSGITISCGSLTEDLRILHLPTANTLMMEALSSGQPSVVHNTAKFLEGSAAPSQDIFVDPDDVVASIAAAPLLTSCRTHTKGCSCCMAHGRGIADVGYTSTRRTSLGSISHPGSAKSGSSGTHQHSARKAQQQPQQQQQPGASPRWYGCLYVTNQSPYDFSVELPAISALSMMLTVLMMQLVPPAMAWRELSELRMTKQSVRHSSSSSSSTILSSYCSRVSSQGGSPHPPVQRSSGSPPLLLAPAEGGGPYVHIRRSGSLDSGLAPTPASVSPRSTVSAPLLPSRPIATSSIVETLRRQVQHSRDMRLKPDAAYLQELQLQRLIGKGGFGTVYAGTWQGSPVAFKVMYVSAHERQLMKSAMEMAVLTSIQHPNIVRVFACLTDLVEEAGSIHGGSCNPLLGVRYRPVDSRQKELPHTLCNIVVMEHLDRGNLHQAMRRGLLHKRLPNKGLVVDMRLLNTVLLQVAYSLQHLHGEGIIHRDLKCENVLLATTANSPLGFVCKLGDFGLARLLMGNNYIRNRSGSGTVAYQAPEVFVEGSKLTPAVDVYSFGIMMYELYCCRRLPFGRTLDTPRIPLPRGCILYRQQQRPHFPPGTWTIYQSLAERCWAAEPADRPSFDEIIPQLQQLLDAAGGPFTCASPFTPE